MIAIVNYGVGNLFSLSSSFGAIGEDVMITSSAEDLRKADRIVLPGVGAFEDAARKLFDSGLASPIIDESATGKPLLGICLGMQLLFEKSYEYGEYEGLGLLPGEIRPISDVIPRDLKIPHIGWNSLSLKKDSPLFRFIRNGDHVYFVHSYYARTDERLVAATAEYGAELTAVVGLNNVYGCQFHPEKSGEVGLNILRAFCEET